MEWIPVLVVAVLVLIVIVRNIYVVQQSRAYVIERLGAFSAGLGPSACTSRPPFVERVAKKRQPEGTGARLSAAARHHQG